ncbi:MAG: glycosyltransferase [Pseudomonas sp.]|uniref:glycosyltransferase n=1 Tax=Pseudomonas sp. TaxID=306 RepID=UPI0030EFC71B
MIGVIIPVHNEEALLGDCLMAVQRAAAHCALDGETVHILVVLDSCTDASAQIALAHGVATIAVDARNVGEARARGVRLLIDQGARWLACTDADSQVAEDWLVAQLSLETDVVCGTVQIGDWGDIPDSVQAQYSGRYHNGDGHRHIHGANLGFSANAYVRAGGFKPLTVDEDVELVASFQRSGATIAWSSSPQVTTSARLEVRVEGGFAAYLRNLHIEQQVVA